MCAEALGRAALVSAFDRVEIAVLDFALGEVRASLAPDSWTRRDVVGHLAGWLEFSGRKLRSIAAGLAFDDVADLEAFNEALYQRYRHAPEAALEAFRHALADYRAVLSLFSDEDLLRNDLPTGFGFELWKYLLMDGVIHPVQHLLYQCRKEGDQARFDRLKVEFLPEFAAFTPDLEAFELREFPPVTKEASMIFLFSGFGPSLETHLRVFAREVSDGPVVLLLQGGPGWEDYLDAYLGPLRAVGLEPLVVAPGDSLTSRDLEVLAGAGGVFIGGGRTEVYHRLYATGEAAATIRRLHQAGVPVVGLSAGAKLLGERVFLRPDCVVQGLGLAPVPPIFPHFEEDASAYQALRYCLAGGQAWGLETDALVSFGPGGPRFHGSGAAYLLEGGAEVRVTRLGDTGRPVVV